MDLQTDKQMDRKMQRQKKERQRDRQRHENKKWERKKEIPRDRLTDRQTQLERMRKTTLEKGQSDTKTNRKMWQRKQADKQTRDAVTRESTGGGDLSKFGEWIIINSPRMNMLFHIQTLIHHFARVHLLSM